MSAILPCSPEQKAKNSETGSILLPAALPDFSKDLKAWVEIKEILNPLPFEGEVPEDYCCPITSCLMRDPVSTADGQTYEREAIEAWLVEHNTSPSAGHAQLKSKELTPIILVKNMIQRFVEKHPKLRDAKEWYLPQAWVKELADACQGGDEKVIQALASRDRRLLVHTFEGEGRKGKTALQLAATGHEKALETVLGLLERRQAGLGLACLLQKDVLGCLPFHHAVLSKKSPEMLLRLLAWMDKASDQLIGVEVWPADFDRGGLNAALHLAIRQGLKETAFVLKGVGASLTQALVGGVTPLHLASESCMTDIAETLWLEQKNLTPGVLNARDAEGLTPLHRAAASNSVKMVEWLLNRGAKVDVENVLGETALHLAAFYNRVEIVRVLLAHQALLGRKDKAGNTALHMAAQSGAGETAILLLESGASSQVKNNQNRTARQEAAVAKQTGMLEAFDKMLTSIQLREEALMRSQGALGLLLLKQQQLIEQLEHKVEEQVDEIVALKHQLVAKVEESVVEELKGSHQRIASRLQEEMARLKQIKADANVLEALKESVRPVLEEEQKRRKVKKRRLEREGLEGQRPAEALLEQTLGQTRRQGEPKQKGAERKAEMRVGGGRRLTWAPDSPLLAALSLEIKADEKEALQLLQHVANGEQKEAEALIQKKPGLLLCKGTVTDLSKREFKRVTAFQYALWALDWHMWRMLLKYMPVKEAAMQFQELEEKGTAHGKQVSWQGLIDAYTAYIPFAAASNWAAAGPVWIKQVGRAQLLLPVHVVNEYCHGGRAFYPIPDFGSGVELTRSRQSRGVDWYDVRSGQAGGHSRGKWRAVGCWGHVGQESASCDRAAVASLLEMRQQQRAELAKTLSAARLRCPGFDSVAAISMC